MVDQVKKLILCDNSIRTEITFHRPVVGEVCPRFLVVNDTYFDSEIQKRYTTPENELQENKLCSHESRKHRSWALERIPVKYVCAECHVLKGEGWLSLQCFPMRLCDVVTSLNKKCTSIEHRPKSLGGIRTS